MKLNKIADCNSVFNCQSRGVCILPNVCQCNSNWTGSACEIRNEIYLIFVLEIIR